MSWLKKAFLLLSLIASKGHDIEDKVILVEKDADEPLRWTEAYAEQNKTPYFTLYEINTVSDLSPLILKRYKQAQSSNGIWLGHRYNENLGGWINMRTKEKTDYLNQFPELNNSFCPNC